MAFPICFVIVVTAIFGLVVIAWFTWRECWVTKVRTSNICRVIRCHKTRICSVCLTNPNDSFKSFKNKITACRTVNCNLKFEIDHVIMERRLDVYCTASTIGSETVILDIGKSFRFIDMRKIHLDVLPCCPKRLSVKGVDETTAFVDRTKEVEIASYDCFGNKASACEHDVIVISQPQDAVTKLLSSVRQGQYSMTLKCHTKCKAHVTIQLSSVCERSNNGDFCSRSEGQQRAKACFPLDIIYPPISAKESKAKISTLEHKIKAGTPITMTLTVNDIFGRPAHVDIDYEISATIGPETRIESVYSQSKNQRRIVPTKAGLHRVKVSLNGHILSIEKSLEVVPSDPDHLDITNIKCSSSNDPSFKPVDKMIYKGDWSNLKAQIMDKFGNTVTKRTNTDQSKIHVQCFDSEGVLMNDVESKDLKLHDGKLDVKFRIMNVGKRSLVIRLTNKKKPTQLMSRQVDIEVVESPCSTFITQQQCAEPIVTTAGSELKFDFMVYDVFGNPVEQDSTVSCRICFDISGEFCKVERDTQSESLLFHVTAHLIASGTKEVQLHVNSDSGNSVTTITRTLHVVASSPHHLDHFRFLTSLFREPDTVTIEADVVDQYGNIVREGDYNIQLVRSSEQDSGITETYEDEPITDGRLHAKVKLADGKKQTLSINSVNKNDENDQHEIQRLHLQATEENTSSSDVNTTGTTVIAGSGYKFHAFPFNVDEQGPRRKAEVFLILKAAGEIRLESSHNDKQTLQVKLEVIPDHDNIQCEHTTAVASSAYTNEILIQTTSFKDKYGNSIPLRVSCPPRLVQKSGPKDQLKINSDASEIIDNTSKISHQFLRHGTYVVSLQCPNLGDSYTDIQTFTINVENAPVDPQLSTVTWCPKFQEMPDQPLFVDDEDFKCVVKLKDRFGNNYLGELTSVKLSVMYENEKATVKRKRILSDGTIEATISLEGVFQTSSPTTVRFRFLLDENVIGEPLELQFNRYTQYDDSNCFTHKAKRGNNVSTETRVIVCKDATEKDIKGQDNSHLDNIKRICRVKEVKQQQSTTFLILPQDLSPDQEKTCRFAVLHLVRALYYRKRAFEADKEREKWRYRAMASYNTLKTTKRDHDRPSFCKRIKENYGKLMIEYNLQACDNIFTFYNMKRDPREIDLHGLLVSDEEKLRKYEEQLVNQGTDEEEAKQIVQKERKEGDEAIRKLEEKLKDYNERWLEIIVGAGHHSRTRGRQKIRPKVEKYLSKLSYSVSPVNEGAVVVTFQEYPSTNRSFGEYYCEKCKKHWKSGKCWKGYYQACNNCYDTKNEIVECFPLKQRPLQRSPNVGTEQHPEQHRQELCQKCQECGSSCDGK